MKIALINENSQAAKNSVIYNTLIKVAEKYGHEVYNYGMEEASDKKYNIRWSWFVISNFIKFKSC